MEDLNWKIFLQTSRRILGKGNFDSFLSDSWCAYTTFSSLIHGVHYFSCGFPEEDECLDSGTKDGGVWRQSFQYSDLAHVIIPKTFYWERTVDGFQSGYKEQDLNTLSVELDNFGIQHRLTEIVLEIKLY